MPAIPRLRGTVVLAVCGVALLLAGVAMAVATGTADKATYATEPIPPTRVTEGDNADPTVMELDGRYWSYATHRPDDAERKVRIRTSSTVDGEFTEAGFALDEIGWADPKSAIFAPDVHAVDDDRILLYFAATPSEYADGDDRKCVGVAVSESGPKGPFVPREEPLECQPDRAGAIDPSYFEDPEDGRVYLLYKSNGLPKPDGAIRRIWLQPMTDDGLRTDGEPVQLASRHTNMEHPVIVVSEGRYFLFVSRQKYETYDYNTSVMSAEAVAGEYENEQEVLTTGNTDVAGPGGADPVATETGTVVFFHGWIAAAGDCTGYRPMYVANLDWGSGGHDPHLADPVSGDASC